MRLKKKKSFNCALFLMMVATICLSTVQIGFSFFSQNMHIGGTGTISSTTTPSTGIVSLDTVLENNKNNIVQNLTNSDAVGGGYTTVVSGKKEDSINNYIVFSDSANATKWRIVGWTNSGMMIVRDEGLKDSAAVWDTGSAHYVPYDTDATAPHTQAVTSLTNVSAICNYLNSNYYNNSIANTSSSDYISSQYINYGGLWDITPMIKNAVYDTGVSAGDVKCYGSVSDSFIGLPVGLLSVTERAIVSSTYDATADKNIYNAVLAGWLATSKDVEMTITEEIDAGKSIFTSTTSASLYAQSGKIGNSSKNKSNTIFRPSLYIKDNVILGSTTTGTGTLGSNTNPYLVTGLK